MPGKSVGKGTISRLWRASTCQKPVESGEYSFLADSTTDLHFRLVDSANLNCPRRDVILGRVHSISSSCLRMYCAWHIHSSEARDWHYSNWMNVVDVKEVNHVGYRRARRRGGPYGPQPKICIRRGGKVGTNKTRSSSCTSSIGPDLHRLALNTFRR